MDDFNGWKKALSGRKGTTLKSYPKLNHLFVEGEGKAKPAEYEKEGHVAKEVVDDVAAWDAVIGAEPVLARVVSGDELDAALTAIEPAGNSAGWAASGRLWPKLQPLNASAEYSGSLMRAS